MADGVDAEIIALISVQCPRQRLVKSNHSRVAVLKIREFVETRKNTDLIFKVGWCVYKR
jgi:hypothetical protein